MTYDGIQPRDQHNEALVQNVRPPDWQNPKPLSRYHLVVIGGGTAGLVSAAAAAMLGGKVALIERHLLGGDCLNVGCVPSKALIRAARVAAQVRSADKFGVEIAGNVHVNFPAVMERMRRLRARISPHDSARRLADLGVHVFFGTGRFTGPNSIEVGSETLRFRKAVIATGARPVAPPIPGLADVDFFTNETIFSLTQLPERLAIIGAGPIGCELAQSFARFGSRVTLLEVLPHILPAEDRDAADIVAEALRRDGIDIVLDCKIAEVKKENGRPVLVVERSGQTERIVVDAVLVGAGRAPNVDELNLDAAGVAYDKKTGVKVDDHLRTSNARIYAAGDVCSTYRFTHAADAMARIVVRNALFLGRRKVSTLTIPWATYTEPEIAHVGLHEKDARSHGIPHRVFMQKLDDVDRAILDSEDEGFVKILTPPKSDAILGATIVSAHASEMISEITVAMVAGVGLGAISNTIHPYPTQAEAIKKIGDAYLRSRLTPLVQTMLKKWLAWTG